MKFYRHTNQIIIEKRVSAILIKHFISKLYFCRSAPRKLVGKIHIFGNKTKAEAFLENRGHTFLDIDKNFTQKKFRRNGAPTSLEDIAKLGTIRIKNIH